ncbi:MAG: c-type cytochrome [Proteobacteria bacterium]|nr:c-type cytochrome [Pseudomonadota bacterium]
MKSVWIGVAALVALVLGIVLLGLIYLYLGSEIIIQRRYPIPSTVTHPLQTAKSIAEGKRLARILGCFDCHGEDLRGRTVALRPSFWIRAPDLRRPVDELSDKDIARAMRHGLRANGTSLWGMPSASFIYMRDADLDALIAYIRSLPAASEDEPAPQYGFSARVAILHDDIDPAAFTALSTDSSLDLGPGYGGGRYLARTTCAECHGLDLEGSDDKRVPSLDGVLQMSLKDFFSLMHRGAVVNHRPMPEMMRLSGMRFGGLADYEVAALYRYLYVRAVALPVSDTPR